MPITFPSSNKQLTLYALSGGGYSTVQPAADSVIVSGSGFGSAPNVVLFRRFTEGDDLSAISTTPATGEIGTFDSVGSSRYYTMPDGKSAYASFNPDTNTQSILQLSFPAARKFRSGFSTMVPVGKYFPGATAVETMSTSSSWKMDWMLMDTDANNDNSEADLCVPTKGTTTGWQIGGNAVTVGSIGPIADSWSWTDWVTVSYWQDSDEIDAVNNASTQEFKVCSPTISGGKTTGVHTVSFSVPSFAPTGAATVTHATAFYAMVKANAYFSRATGAEAETQAVRRNWYLATGDNSRQCILLGNAAGLTNCTRMDHIAPDSWTDTEVVFTPSAFESSIYTHYHIIKPDGSVVSGAL